MLCEHNQNIPWSRPFACWNLLNTRGNTEKCVPVAALNGAFLTGRSDQKKKKKKNKKKQKKKKKKKNNKRIFFYKNRD